MRTYFIKQRTDWFSAGRKTKEKSYRTRFYNKEKNRRVKQVIGQRRDV